MGGSSIGALCERVTVESPRTTADSQGGRSRTWDIVTVTWAAVEYLATQQDERQAAAAVTTVPRCKVTLDYRPDILPTWRLLWRPYRATYAKVLQVSAISPSPDRRRVQLDCIETPLTTAEPTARTAPSATVTRGALRVTTSGTSPNEIVSIEAYVDGSWIAVANVVH